MRCSDNKEKGLDYQSRRNITILLFQAVLRLEQNIYLGQSLTLIKFVCIVVRKL